MSTSDQPGIIGLGKIGQDIVSVWLDEGLSATVYDIDDEKMSAMADAGADPAASPREVAEESDVTFITVGTDDEVESVLFDTDGVAEGATPGDIITVTSTVNPQRPPKWADRLDEGKGLVDAPLARGIWIRERDALGLVGGEQDDFERVKALYEPFTRGVYHLGDVGTGMMGKTANNQILWACCIADYEAFRLAQSYGVDIEVLREALQEGSGSNYAIGLWHNPDAGTWRNEDLRLVFELAAELGIEMPQTERTRDAMQALTMEELWSLTPADYRASD